MNKLLTVYDDDEALNNVISALTMEVDEAYFVYHHEVNEIDFINIDKVLNKHRNIKTHFINLKNDEAEILDIIDRNQDIIIDVGGAKYLSLLLFELAKDRTNRIIYFDDQENVIKEYRTHTVIVKDVFRLTIEDIFELRNGRIIENMHASAKDRKTIEIIDRLVEKNLDNYSSFIRYLTKLNAIANSSKRSQGKYVELKEKQIKDIRTDACYKKCRDLFEVRGNTLIFATAKLRQLIEVSGAFLENYLYHKLLKSKKFDEVMMSAVIDFSDSRNKFPVRCEIDMLALKNNRLLFVSCKSNKIDTSDLNEIYVHNSMFGNVLSAPAICLCEEADDKFPSIYSKAQQMNIYVIDRSNLSDGTFPEVFSRIIDGTYVYDELPL